VAVYDRNFVVDNVEDGYDFYCLDNCELLQSYITRLAHSRRPKEVKFAEQGEVVVGGSDHGDVYVFGCRTGSQLDVIHHGKHDMVQTVTVRAMPIKITRWMLTAFKTLDLRNSTMIAAASSSADLECPTISIWRRNMRGQCAGASMAERGNKTEHCEVF
jgi:hypothetical protein